MTVVPPFRPSAGALLSQAAYMAIGAQRLTIAAAIRLDDAEAQISDLAFLARADIQAINFAALLKDLGVLADNLQHLADAFGHYEVQRRSASG